MKRLPLIVGLVLMTGLAGWLLLSFDLSFLRRLSPWGTALVCSIAVLFMVNYAFGITLLLRGMGQVVPVGRVYHVVSAASTASYLGSVQLSVPVRIYMLYRVLGVPLGTGTGAVGVETLLWLAMMGLIVAIPVPAIWGSFVWMLSALAIACVVCGALALRYFPALGQRIPERIRGISLARIRSFAAELYDAIRLVDRRQLGLAAAVFAFNYVLDAFSLYVVLRELGYSVNPFFLLHVIVLSYLAGTLSMIPMGLGTRDISFVVVLSQLGPTPEIAAAAALIQRLLRTVIPLLLGLLSLNVLGLGHLSGPRVKPEDPR